MESRTVFFVAHVPLARFYMQILVLLMVLLGLPNGQPNGPSLLTAPLFFARRITMEKCISIQRLTNRNLWQHGLATNKWGNVHCDRFPTKIEANKDGEMKRNKVLFRVKLSFAQFKFFSAKFVCSYLDLHVKAMPHKCTHVEP